MIIKSLKYIAIFIAIILTWIVFSTFSLYPILSSTAIKLFFYIFNACLPTVASVAIAYKFSPKFKVVTSIVALLLSLFMGSTMLFASTGLLGLENYNYLPFVGMLLTGSIFILCCYKSWITNKILVRFLWFIFVYFLLLLGLSIYPFIIKS